MSVDSPACGKPVYVTPGVGDAAPPNRAERRRQKREKLAGKCGRPAGHKGRCAP